MSPSLTTSPSPASFTIYLAAVYEFNDLFVFLTSFYLSLCPSDIFLSFFCSYFCLCLVNHHICYPIMFFFFLQCPTLCIFQSYIHKQIKIHKHKEVFKGIHKYIQFVHRNNNSKWWALGELWAWPADWSLGECRDCAPFLCVVFVAVVLCFCHFYSSAAVEACCRMRWPEQLSVYVE